ncbi:MAG: helix-turn-helix transcriptional regulator [Streptococcaceae bacterium]|jgi:Fe-S cluster biosynthesis and repair protein YggX|nr:helix-turn-helix transcriptional regulator [Streptococcaceae bacterium]
MEGIEQGTILDIILKRRGYNRYQFSKKTNITQSVLQSINKKCFEQWTIKNIKLIAENLEMTIMELFEEMCEIEDHREFMEKQKQIIENNRRKYKKDSRI